MLASYKTKYIKFLDPYTQVDLDSGEIYHLDINFIKPQIGKPCYAKILINRTITEIVYE